MAIELSDVAASRVQHFLDNRGKGIGLRLGVKTTGCSGLAYTIEYADDVQKFEEVIEDKEVTILIDPKAAMYLIGSTMDFVEEKMQSGFIFTNPNEKSQCGCGKSFNV